MHDIRVRREMMKRQSSTSLKSIMTRYRRVKFITLYLIPKMISCIKEIHDYVMSSIETRIDTYMNNPVGINRFPVIRVDITMKLFIETAQGS